MKVLKAIAVNFLSIIYIPFFLLATMFRLVGKSLEKAIFIIGASLAIIAIILFQVFLTDENMRQTFVLAIILFAILGIFTFIIIAMVTFGSAIFLAAIGILNSILDFLHTVFNELSHLIMDKCDNLADSCRFSSRPMKYLFCPFYFIAKTIRYLTAQIFAVAFPVSIIAVTALLLGAPIFSHFYLKKLFGFGLFEFANLFSAIEIIFSIIYVLIFLGAVSLIAVVLGAEWGEWGAEELALISGKTISADTIPQSIIIHESEPLLMQDGSDLLTVPEIVTIETKEE